MASQHSEPREPGQEFFASCLTSTKEGEGRVFLERTGTREQALSHVAKILTEHYVGEEVILRAGGYQAAADILRNSLPESKRIRAGDLGEALAVEYLHSETPFKVPVLKLRYKSDRDTPLHGNDVIAVDSTPASPRVLKGECKSRASFGPSHINEAGTQLDEDGGRPRPSSLAFVTKMLYGQGRDDEAKLYQEFQSAKRLRLRDVEQLIFVLAGESPRTAFSSVPRPGQKGIRRRSALAIVVNDYSAFVQSVFVSVYGAGSGID